MTTNKYEMGSIVDIFKTYQKFLQMFGMYKHEQESTYCHAMCQPQELFS
jgi:hypothetical protein